MVELGNHQGRPPGYTQNQPIQMNNETSHVAVASLLEPWMNMDITNLDAELMSGNPSTFRDRTSDSTLNFLSSKEILGLLNIQELQELGRELDPAYPNSIMCETGSDKHTYTYTGEQDLTNKSPYMVWGAPMDVDALKLDDIFQVDEDDLIQGPTLAELNANDEPFFDMTFDDYVNKSITDATSTVTSSHGKISPVFEGQKMSAEDSQVKKELPSLTYALSVSAVPAETQRTETRQTRPDAKLCSEMVKQERLGSGQHRKPILLDTLLGLRHRKDAERDTSPSTSVSKSQEKSIQIPPNVRHRNDSTTDVSLCSLSSMSSLSNDEGFGSQAEDSDVEDQLSSDYDSQTGESPETKYESSKHAKSTRKKRYFWQYNIQSKGPKGPRITLNTTSMDPHVLNDVLDPVFSSECMLEGVKHAGKARKGDGNDLTPNPRKLHSIGLELRALNKMINDLAPVTNVPFNARPKTRKEKNKLASRACRLKKKAQHEANKLKLYGLQQEHKKLMNLVADARNIVRKYVNDPASPSESCSKRMENIIEVEGEFKVAGHAAEFVNKVLDKVAQGQSNGGLHDI